MTEKSMAFGYNRLTVSKLLNKALSYLMLSFHNCDYPIFIVLLCVCY